MEKNNWDLETYIKSWKKNTFVDNPYIFFCFQNAFHCKRVQKDHRKPVTQPPAYPKPRFDNSLNIGRGHAGHDWDKSFLKLHSNSYNPPLSKNSTSKMTSNSS